MGLSVLTPPVPWKRKSIPRKRSPEVQCFMDHCLPASPTPWTQVGRRRDEQRLRPKGGAVPAPRRPTSPRWRRTTSRRRQHQRLILEDEDRGPARSKEVSVDVDRAPVSLSALETMVTGPV